MEESKSAAYWLGIIASILAVLTFLGVSNVEQLKDVLFSSGPLEDPCGALTPEYVAGLGADASDPVRSGARFDRDTPSPDSSWGCAWIYQDNRGRATQVGYHSGALTENWYGSDSIDGIPDSQIGPAPFSGCWGGWPTSFGYVEMDLDRSCAVMEELAIDIYEGDLSR